MKKLVCVCGEFSFPLLIVLKSDKGDELIFAITSGISRFHASPINVCFFITRGFRLVRLGTAFRDEEDRGESVKPTSSSPEFRVFPHRRTNERTDRER